MEFIMSRFCCVILGFIAGMAAGLEFTSTGPTSIEKASGQTVKLECQLSDTGIYNCKVKKAPGIRSLKILLTVMVKPSRPRCYAEGPTEEGKDIVLRCVSNEGTNPLQYTWERTSGSEVLPASAVMDPVGGTVNVRSASSGASGTYRCRVSNRVGSEECVLQLSVTPPTNTADIIAVAIKAVLLIHFIITFILLIIAIILHACHRKKYEEEICNEVGEDVPPPKSRVSTARSFTSMGSQCSSLGSMSPSNLHEYALKPQHHEIPSSEEAPSRGPPAPLNDGTAPAPVSRTAGPDPGRMGSVPVMIVPARNRDGSIV